jgi:hypothetical protein
MSPGGVLAQGPAGAWLGVGPGRGIGLLFVLAGVGLIIVTAAAGGNRRLRYLEAEVPDAGPDLPLASA